MAASTYLANMILNGILRGVAITLPADLFVSLHTADPGNTGANEVTTGTWPAYVRKSALAGDVIANAFAAATTKSTLSAKQILWPGYDGAGTITITHFSIWDASAAGNCLFSGKLVDDPTAGTPVDAPKTLSPTDEFVLNASKLGVAIS